MKTKIPLHQRVIKIRMLYNITMQNFGKALIEYLWIGTLNKSNTNYKVSAFLNTF